MKVNGTPSKYIKKPIPVTAYQWWKVSDYCENEKRDVDYFRHPDVNGMTRCKECDGLMHWHGYMETLEGGHTVCPSDYILTGIEGEKWPVKERIFLKTYETFKG